MIDDTCLTCGCPHYGEDAENHGECGFDDAAPVAATAETTCPHVRDREPMSYYADAGDAEGVADGE